MHGFLVFLGADAPVVIFGNANKDAAGFNVEWIDGGETLRCYVPMGQVVAFIPGTGLSESRIALALCGSIEPVCLPRAQPEPEAVPD